MPIVTTQLTSVLPELQRLALMYDPAVAAKGKMLELFVLQLDAAVSGHIGGMIINSELQLLARNGATICVAIDHYDRDIPGDDGLPRFHYRIHVRRAGHLSSDYRTSSEHDAASYVAPLLS